MKKVITSIIPFAVFVFFIVQVSPAYAVEHYMDSESGTDQEECGTQESPCATFTYVLNQEFDGGDKFYFKGTFSGDDIGHAFGSDISGTADNYTEFSGWPGEEPAVFDIEETERQEGLRLGDADYVKIHDLQFTNAEHHAVIVGGGSNVELYNLLLNNNEVAGIFVNAGASDIYIYNNFFYDHDSNGAAGISISAAEDIRIENNTFINNYQCVFVYEISGEENTVQNNIFYMQSGNQSAIRDDSMRFGAEEADFITNADINYNIYYGTAEVDPGSSNVVCYDHASGSTPPTTCYGNFTDWKGSDFAQDSLSFEEDPLLVSTDDESYDFHLQFNSPAIDSGEASCYASEDYDQETRPYGLACDIGADEFPNPSVATDASADTGVTTATVSWAAPTDAEITYYTIEYALDDQGTGAISIEEIESVEYKLTGLTPNTTYYYSIASCYVTDYQTYCSEDTLNSEFQTQSATLKKVKDLKVKKKNRKQKRVTVSWKTHSYVTVLKLQKWNKKQKKYKKYKTYRVKKSKRIKIIKKLKPDTRYRVRTRKRRKIDGDFYFSNYTKWIKFKTAI